MAKVSDGHGREARARTHKFGVPEKRLGPRPLVVVGNLSLDVPGRPRDLFIDGEPQCQRSLHVTWLVTNSHVVEGG